jgi:hypothetical protein
MIAVGNRETNMVAMVAVKANSVKLSFDSQRISHANQCWKGKACHRLVLIAQEARISFSDIAVILKKKEAAVNDDGNGRGNGNGTEIVANQQLQNDNNKSPNEKTTQAYKLFSECKKPFEVAIELGMREAQVNKFFREFWKLKRLNQLYEVYPKIRHCLPSFLKLHKALKKSGLNPGNVEWFANAVETEAIKIPEIQKQYAKVKDELEDIDYKKTMAKHQLDNMNNHITYLNKISYNKRNEIACLQIGVQELEGYVYGLQNHNQQPTKTSQQ